MTASKFRQRIAQATAAHQDALARKDAPPAQDTLGLWDLDPTPLPLPKPRKPPKPAKAVKPRREARHPAQDHWHPIECAPTCLVCERPEIAGLCPPGECAIVCGAPRPRRKDGRAPVDVCLLTRESHVTATPAGDRLAVILCPGCGRMHWHAARYGAVVRVGGCGTPYVVHLNRPKITAAGETP